MLFGVTDHVIEAVDHNFLETLVDQLLIPKVPLAVLHPLEIGNGDSAGVGENIRNDENLLFGQNRICDEGGRTIRAFAKDFGLDKAAHYGR